MEAIREIKQNKLNFLKTCFMFLMFLVIGLGIAIPGPSLLDLQIAVNCSLEEIGYLLPGRAFGYAAGSILGGFVPDRCDKQPFIIACFTLSGLFLGLLPWNRTLIGLIVTAVFKGLFMGIMEVCGNVFVIQMWGKGSAPFIQILYLFFGFGAFIAPLITEPFLLPLMTDNQNGTSSLQQYTPDDVKLHYPYTYVAIYAIVVVIMFTIVFCLRRESKNHPSIEVKNEDGSSKHKWRTLLAVTLGTMYLHFYFGNEITFGSFLTPYAVKSELQLKKATGAFMTSVFWGTYTFFRVAIVVCNDLIGLGNLLTIELVLQIIGNAVLVYGTYFVVNETIVWVATVLMGLGFSACFALTIGYLQQYFVITGGMVSSFLIAACIGEFIYPFITARYIEVYPNIFILTCSFCTLCAIFVFIALKGFCRKFL